MNSSSSAYVAGQSLNKSCNYLQNVRKLKELIDNMEINTKDEARAWMAKSEDYPDID